MSNENRSSLFDLILNNNDSQTDSPIEISDLVATTRSIVSSVSKPSPLNSKIKFSAGFRSNKFKLLENQYNKPFSNTEESEHKLSKYDLKIDCVKKLKEKFVYDIKKNAKASKRRRQSLSFENTTSEEDEENTPLKRIKEEVNIMRLPPASDRQHYSSVSDVSFVDRKDIDETDHSATSDDLPSSLFVETENDDDSTAEDKLFSSNEEMTIHNKSKKLSPTGKVAIFSSRKSLNNRNDNLSESNEAVPQIGAASVMNNDNEKCLSSRISKERVNLKHDLITAIMNSSRAQQMTSKITHENVPGLSRTILPTSKMTRNVYSQGAKNKDAIKKQNDHLKSNDTFSSNDDTNTSPSAKLSTTATLTVSSSSDITVVPSSTVCGGYSSVSATSQFGESSLSDFSESDVIMIDDDREENTPKGEDKVTSRSSCTDDVVSSCLSDITTIKIEPLSDDTSQKETNFPVEGNESDASAVSLSSWDPTPLTAFDDEQLLEKIGYDKIGSYVHLISLPKYVSILEHGLEVFYAAGTNGYVLLDPKLPGAISFNRASRIFFLTQMRGGNLTFAVKRKQSSNRLLSYTDVSNSDRNNDRAMSGEERDNDLLPNSNIYLHCKRQVARKSTYSRAVNNFKSSKSSVKPGVARKAVAKKSCFNSKNPFSETINQASKTLENGTKHFVNPGNSEKLVPKSIRRLLGRKPEGFEIPSDCHSVDNAEENENKNVSAEKLINSSGVENDENDDGNTATTISSEHCGYSLRMRSKEPFVRFLASISKKLILSPHIAFRYDADSSSKETTTEETERDRILKVIRDRMGLADISGPLTADRIFAHYQHRVRQATANLLSVPTHRLPQPFIKPTQVIRPVDSLVVHSHCLTEIKPMKYLKHKLNADAWRHVFQFLPRSDLCSCLRVCRAWNQWALSPKFWKFIYFTDQNIEPEHLTGIVLRQPISLDISFTKIGQRQLIYLLDRLPRLRSLYLNGSSWSTVATLSTAHCPLLTILHIKDCFGLYDHCVDKLFSPPKELKPSMLNGCRLRYLEDLSLAGSDITDKSLEIISAALHKRPGSIYEPHSSSVYSASPRRAVLFSGSSKIPVNSTSGITDISVSSKSLMYSYKVPPETEACGITLSGKVTHLKILDLSYCTRITDAGIETLCSNVNIRFFLEELSLASCSKLTPHSLDSLLSCRQLKLLDTSACPCITGNDCERFAADLEKKQLGVEISPRKYFQVVKKKVIHVQYKQQQHRGCRRKSR